MKNVIRWGFVMLSVSLVSLSSCKKDDDNDDNNNNNNNNTTLSYIGSSECQTCHAEIYNKFIKSGHPYKLNKVNGSQPVIPYTTDAGMTIPTPAGYDWTNITYMIGGYGWKARFIDSDGYIITQNDDTQYNLADGSQVAYHGSDPIGTKKYTCGKCHTTGWKSTDDGGVAQDGLPGMGGEFFAGGVHCEACHGMGSKHAATSSVSDITKDNGSDLCGQCHTRNTDHTIAASGGFVQHHEQYDEWLASGGHYTNEIGCNTCHDPHSSVVYDDVAPGEGVKVTCESCHATYNASSHVTSLDCTTCHMPLAAKSAIKINKYKGDVSSHTFKINTDSLYSYFSTDGSVANSTGLGLSLDMVCYQCHKDINGEGGSNSTKTMVQLSTKATNFHGTK